MTQILASGYKQREKSDIQRSSLFLGVADIEIH